ncbi:MAG: MarR family winged helix-turn-helix transcriptional regulator [Roseburia sp.]|nr:MarR family winged helix-turn-helix transcriptional regulator [Roseburia sp.]
MEKVFEHFTVSILKLNKLVQRIKAIEMAEFGLKGIHVMCAYYLTEHADGLTASELSKYTLEDKAAISRALSQLKKKGFVSYDEKTYNAKITLTDAGKSFAAAVMEKADRAVAAGSADQTEDERLDFYKKLSDIVDNLEAYLDTLATSHASRDTGCVRRDS